MVKERLNPFHVGRTTLDGTCIQIPAWNNIVPVDGPENCPFAEESKVNTYCNHPLANNHICVYGNVRNTACPLSLGPLLIKRRGSDDE